MPKEDKNQAYRNEYQKQHYDRVTILLPKDTKKYIQEYAKANDKSVTKLILDLLKDNNII